MLLSALATADAQVQQPVLLCYYAADLDCQRLALPSWIFAVTTTTSPALRTTCVCLYNQNKLLTVSCCSVHQRLQHHLFRMSRCCRYLDLSNSCFSASARTLPGALDEMPQLELCFVAVATNPAFSEFASTWISVSPIPASVG